MKMWYEACFPECQRQVIKFYNVDTRHEKSIHDAVRPFSAVAHVYGDGLVRAWAGPENGIVDDLPANQWKSYIPTGDHPGEFSGQ